MVIFRLGREPPCSVFLRGESYRAMVGTGEGIKEEADFCKKFCDVRNSA